MSDETQKTYNAVEKDGVVTAIWEMEGNRHVRTIDPRSREGKALLGNYTPQTAAPAETAKAANAGEATNA